MQNELNMAFESRITALEAHNDNISKDMGKLESKVDVLVRQVGQIRNALYLMALCLAANVPLLKGLPDFLKTLAGF